MAIALYARCSTPDQSLDAQLDALRAYAQRRGGEAREYSDQGVSGGRASRAGLDALMAACRRREVEAVVVTKLDRLGRSLRHLCEVAEELASLGVDLVVLDQAIDTSTASGRLLFGVLGSVAEFERGLIQERTRAGLAAARRRGKRLGRPQVLSARDLARARRMRGAGRSLREIGRVLGCGKTTVARALRAAKFTWEAGDVRIEQPPKRR